MIRDSGAAFITALDKWLEETLESPLGRDRVEKLVKRAHSLMEQNPEMEIDGLVELAEETALMPFGDSEPEDLMEYIIVPPSMKPTVMPRFIPAVIPDTIHETQLIKPSRFLGSKTKFIEAIKSAMSDPRARRAGFTAAAGLFAITVSLIYSSVMNVDAIKETNPGNTSVFPSTTSINAVVGVPQADTGAWVAADDLVTFTDKNFDIKAAKRVLIKLKATAYDLSYASCGKNRGDPQYGITYSGTRAEAGRTIAVDPAVIPLGTTVRLTFPEKYGYMDGLYIAEDTGRLIKGNHIDVFFGEDEEGSSLINQKALRFGVQYVTAEIVK
ncbi:MAG: hypothetical protein HGA22_12030 [Clostridiales bacterium]|nr:hypothetical protein [Clostridiales bacterium]